MPSGRVRAYVSNLYQEIYDAACAARRPHLDIRVLLPQEAASGRCETGGIRTDSSLLMPTAVSSSRSSGALSAVGCGWVTRDLAELEPDLQVLLTDEPQEHHFASLNAERVRVGFSALNTISLQEVARRAYKPEYFYAEDVTADIPNFTNVSRILQRERSSNPSTVNASRTVRVGHCLAQSATFSLNVNDPCFGISPSQEREPVIREQSNS